MKTPETPDELTKADEAALERAWESVSDPEDDEDDLDIGGEEDEDDE